MTCKALKKEPQEFICHCIKAWSREMGHVHIEAAGLIGNCHQHICILDALKGHCKPRSNVIVVATANKQLELGDVGLPEYVEKCTEVIEECNFGAVYDKCLPKNSTTRAEEPVSI